MMAKILQCLSEKNVYTLITHFVVCRKFMFCLYHIKVTLIDNSYSIILKQCLAV